MSASSHTGPSALPLHGESIVFLSTIDWDFLWQGHQEIASRFAAGGNSVIYVENTGARSIRVSDAGRVLRRLAHWLLELRAPRVATAGVNVIAPLLIPFPRLRIARVINERILVPRLARRIRSLLEPSVIFTLLPTPSVIQLVRLLRTKDTKLVYWCLADFRELSDLGPLLEVSEKWVVRSADVVFVQTAEFAKRFANDNPRIHEFQFGVNRDVFAAAEHRPLPELATLPRPRIGYVGGLHRHLDFDLLAAIARALPEASITLVGPLQHEAGPLRSLPNVHFVGPRPFTELPRALASFDVGLIPYRRNRYTDTVCPTKLFEYLAMGLPVVSTCLPEVVKLGLPTTALRAADDASTFIALTREALADDSPASRRARVDLTAGRDWSTIVRRMAELISMADPSRSSAKPTSDVIERR